MSIITLNILDIKDVILLTLSVDITRITFNQIKKYILKKLNIPNSHLFILYYKFIKLNHNMTKSIVNYINNNDLKNNSLNIYLIKQSNIFKLSFNIINIFININNQKNINLLKKLNNKIKKIYNYLNNYNKKLFIEQLVLMAIRNNIYDEFFNFIDKNMLDIINDNELVFYLLKMLNRNKNFFNINQNSNTSQTNNFCLIKSLIHEQIHIIDRLI